MRPKRDRNASIPKVVRYLDEPGVRKWFVVLSASRGRRSTTTIRPPLTR